MKSERERLEALLGGEDARWFRVRLRRHYERRGELPKRVSLSKASEGERALVDRLLGRPPSRSDRALVLPVARLDEILRAAELCDGVVDALRLLEGPLRDRRAEARAWAEARAAIEARVGDRPWLREWFESLRAAGLWRRKAKGDPQRALELAERALLVIDRFPLPGVALPALAAGTYGDAHALDQHQELGLLVVRAAACYASLDDWQSADGWRECWAAIGVVCDELSAPVLTLNIGSEGEGLTDQVLRLHRERGEACALSLRQLVRHPPSLAHLAGRELFVCENPSIVAVAAERLGVNCAPLVCTSGQPCSAARLLLVALARQGLTLRVQADFDIDGLHIAAKTLALNGACPWRMNAADYSAAKAGPPLRRDEVPPFQWAPDLCDAMRSRGVGVHEESLLDKLIADLG